jgi:hypothetical protein
MGQKAQIAKDKGVLRSEDHLSKLFAELHKLREQVRFVEAATKQSPSRRKRLRPLALSTRH